jgi:HAD superfamily phosphoserine phosphatase-like hydrolase
VSTPRIGICLDLDATLVSTPLLSMVASAADLVEEIDVLTRATDAGELPFARSLRLRCRILDQVPVSEAARRVAVAPLEPDVLECVRAHADRVHFVTEVPDCWIGDFAERLGLDVRASKAVVDGDRLVEVVEVIDKAAVVTELQERYDQVAVVGAGMGDLAMLEIGDIRVAYGVSAPLPVRSLAQYWVAGGRALCQLSRPW